MILENLERMFQCLSSVSNKQAVRYQALALESEASFAIETVRSYNVLWTKELPFKEACDVSFLEWYKKVGYWITEMTSLFEDFEQERMKLTDTLQALSNVLKQTYTILLSPDEQAYKAMFERLSATCYKELIDDTIGSAKKWMSSAPTKRRLKFVTDKYEKEKQKFFSGKWEDGLRNYFDMDESGNLLEGTDAGKFVYKYRLELTDEELGEIVAGCHKLEFYRQEISRLKSGNKTTKPSTDTAPKELSTMPQVKMPLIFDTTLRHKAEAANLFVEILLKQCEPSICRSTGKTWGHVKEAFEMLHFIDPNCSGVDFGTAIHHLCSNRKANNVEQAIKRHTSRDAKYIDSNKEKGIIESLTELFQPVRQAMDRRE